LDTSAVQLERARTSLTHTQLILADVRSLPFGDGQFDHAIALGVLDCLTNITDLGLAVAECARVLRPGGHWFVNFYTRNTSKYFEDKYSTGESEFGAKRVFRSKSGLVFRHHTLREFLTVVDEAFDLLKCELRPFLSMNQRTEVAGYCLILRKPPFRSHYR